MRKSVSRQYNFEKRQIVAYLLKFCVLFRTHRLYIFLFFTNKIIRLLITPFFGTILLDTTLVLLYDKCGTYYQDMKIVVVKKKKIILVGITLALLVSIPLTISLFSHQEKTQSNAASSTSLSFTPSSTTTAPIQTSIGSNFDLNMYVNPGTNDVSFVRYQVTYDPTKVQLVTSNPVTLNSSIFTNVEGPVLNSGSIAQSVSIGDNPTNVITQNTLVATLHFKAIGDTSGGTTTLSFGSVSEALSAGPSEQASQDVLSTTSPAVVSISGTGTPSASPSPTSSPTELPLPTITGTALGFTVLLDGIGSAGDNANPSGNSLSNKNPLHPQRVLNVQVYDTNNNIVASSSAPINYDTNAGAFDGAVGLPTTVASGNYYVKVTTDSYLRKLVPGIQQIVSGQTTQLPSVELVAGDTNNDNVLNILDYNALLDCGYGDISPLPINDPNSTYNSTACQVHQPSIDVDSNDDGIINSTDYNLFLRELSVQNGD
jgi:hypothetical protein